MIRRVVSGHDEAGNSMFASDDEVPAVLVPGANRAEIAVVWGSDSTQSYPDTGAMPIIDGVFPPPGGFRLVHLTMPVATGAAGDGGSAELSAELDRDEAGFHTTDTTDMGVVISGEIVMMLDDGAETVLRAGDTFVQSGTRHAWRNVGQVPVSLVVAVAGANRQ
jgi:mannose-6-phosphate isomerase-like protein (cupin superfamily)